MHKIFSITNQLNLLDIFFTLYNLSKKIITLLGFLVTKLLRVKLSYYM